MKASDESIEDEILEMLMRRGEGKTICPSEVARKLYPESWREELEHVRQIARKLVKEEKIVITQAGQVIDPDSFKGAIRLRLK
jgi:hypothetical protein